MLRHWLGLLRGFHLHDLCHLLLESIGSLWYLWLLLLHSSQWSRSLACLEFLFVFFFLLLKFLRHHRVEYFLEQRVSTQNVSGPLTIAVRMNADSHELLLSQAKVVPDATDAFCVLNSWHLHYRTHLVLDSLGLINTIDFVLSRFSAGLRCLEVLEDASHLGISRQVSEHNSDPLGFTCASGVVGDPDLNPDFVFVFDRLDHQGIEHCLELLDTFKLDKSKGIGRSDPTEACLWKHVNHSRTQ